MPMHTVLALADTQRRTFLAAQLNADGHSVCEAAHRAAAVAKLSTHPIGLTILGELDEPGSAPVLLRELRSGHAHPRVPPLPARDHARRYR